MPDIYMDVDAAVIVPVNIMPLLDDTDFKTIEVAVVYDSAGMDLVWNFVPCAGPATATAVTPTTGGNYDWTEHIANKGMYSIEIPASGGASINNNTEGVGWFTGVATGILPWRGPTIGFRRAALNDLLIEGGTASTNLEDFFDGTGYAGGTAKLTVNTTQVNGTAQTAGDLAAMITTIDDFIDTEIGTPSNFGSGATISANLVDIEAQTDDIGVAGAGLTGILDMVCESQGSYTLKQAISIIISVLAGVTSANGATLATPNGTTTRVSAIIDANNNRTAMTLTPSS